MRFAIEATDTHVEHLLEEYPLLSDYGFEIVQEERRTRTPIRDENGNRIYQIGTTTKPVAYVTVDTLEQLIDLSKRVCDNTGLIVFPARTIYDSIKHEWVDTGDALIEIYDGYRE
jgi:hypothetical protein